MGLKIGNVQLENPLILGPLHGVNCTAFRVMCRQRGAALVTTPMIHALSIINNKKTDSAKEEQPLSIQIIGAEPKQVGKAVEKTEHLADVIDLNFGCPDRNIIKQKMGAWFAKHPEETKGIISAAIDNTNKPVTIKIRLGWDDRKHNYLTTAKIAEDLGVSAITLHARTKLQGYSGKADWGAIKELKKRMNIPIIGNGDVWSADDAKRMLEETGCDFVMIARGAMGNPHIFKQSKELIQHGKEVPNLDDTCKEIQLKEFIELTKTHKIPFKEIKKHAFWFCGGMTHAAEKKRAIAKTKNAEELLQRAGILPYPELM